MKVRISAEFQVTEGFDLYDSDIFDALFHVGAEEESIKVEPVGGFKLLDLPEPGATVMVIPNGAESEPERWWEATLLFIDSRMSSGPFAVRSTRPGSTAIQKVANVAVEPPSDQAEAGRSASGEVA